MLTLVLLTMDVVVGVWFVGSGGSCACSGDCVVTSGEGVGVVVLFVLEVVSLLVWLLVESVCELGGCVSLRNVCE